MELNQQTITRLIVVNVVVFGAAFFIAQVTGFNIGWVLVFAGIGIIIFGGFNLNASPPPSANRHFLDSDEKAQLRPNADGNMPKTPLFSWDVILLGIIPLAVGIVLSFVT